MKTPDKFRWIIGMMAMLASFCAQAYPGEGIVLDPATGNYTITYRGDPGSSELSQTVFVPSTKIAPAVRSSFRLNENRSIIYRYTVFNGATAKQSIVGFRLDQIINPIVGEFSFPDDSASQAEIDTYNATTKTALASPIGWHGDFTRYRIATHGEKLDRIAWRPNPPMRTGGIPAGRTLTGFGFSSLDLPGVGSSKMDGMGDVLGFPDEGPLEDSAVFAELNSLRDNDFVARPAAVPTIPVPEPFDAAVVLERIQTHAHTWIALQLLDPTFASQLDRYFQSAISAYRLNQTKVGKEHIQTLRKLIKKEQPDADKEDDERNGKEDDEHNEKGDDADKTGTKRPLIDKLAARILDFDLKYVAKRAGGDGSD